MKAMPFDCHPTSNCRPRLLVDSKLIVVKTMHCSYGRCTALPFDCWPKSDLNCCSRLLFDLKSTAVPVEWYLKFLFHLIKGQMWSRINVSNWIRAIRLQRMRIAWNSAIWRCHLIVYQNRSHIVVLGCSLIPNKLVCRQCSARMTAVWHYHLTFDQFLVLVCTRFALHRIPLFGIAIWWLTPTYRGGEFTWCKTYSNTSRPWP